MNEKENVIVFRNYYSGDEDSIIELMKPYWTHFNSDKAHDFWKWEYTKCPNGQALIMLAEHNEKIIGQIAALPMEMSCGEIIISGGKGEGLVIHPEYRGNIAQRFFPKKKEVRIYESLLKNFLSAAEKQQIDILWGFPNEKRKTPIKLGYHHIPIPYTILILPIDVTKTFHTLFSLKIKNKLVLNSLIFTAKIYYKFKTMNLFNRKIKNEQIINVRQISRLDDSYDKFWVKYFAENKCITIKRDHKYVNWRLIENLVIPHQVFVCEREGEITGYIATNVDKDNHVTGNIVDILGLEGCEDDLHILLEHVIHFLKNEGIKFINIWLVKNKHSKKYIKILKKHKFLELPIKTRYHLNIKILNSNLNKKFVYDLDNWYITMAFTEGIS